MTKNETTAAPAAASATGAGATQTPTTAAAAASAAEDSVAAGARWQALGALGPLAQGSISPTQVSSESLFAALDRSYVPTTHRIVASCIDGRLDACDSNNTEAAGAPAAHTSAAHTSAPLAPEAGSQALTPNAAGGSLALWIAVRLSGLDLGLDEFLAILQNAGLPLGGHSDEHAHGTASGCGANDKLDAILTVLGAQATAPFLIATAQSLGFALSERAQAKVIEQAALLAPDVAANKLDTASARLAALAKHGSAPLLAGGHTEQLVVLNQVFATTLDRNELFATLPEGTAVFNVDIWALDCSARMVLFALEKHGIPNTPNRDELCAALLFYNLSTALVLCAPDMPVAVRSQL